MNILTTILCMGIILGQSRKNARAHVTVTYPGTGEISIDGKGIDYFRKIQSKEQASVFEFR